MLGDRYENEMAKYMAVAVWANDSCRVFKKEEESR